MNNYDKGNLGELPTQEAFKKLGFHVKDHKVEDKGLDITAKNASKLIVGEVLNWYGGFINDVRFKSIVNSLFSIAANERFLLAYGVDATFQQKRLLLAYGVKYLHFEHPIKKADKFIVNRIAKAIRSLSVITFSVNSAVDSVTSGFYSLFVPRFEVVDGVEGRKVFAGGTFLVFSERDLGLLETELGLLEMT